jgi:limonene-1,2-epoxide hydrolase
MQLRYDPAMLRDDDPRGAPTALRGWLSDVYFPSLLDASAHHALATRLGARAHVDEPLFGHAEGTAALEQLFAKIGVWLGEHGATYTREHFTTGIDRDVTEGALELSLTSRSITLPVAVVAERRPSREVGMRVYYAASAIRAAAPPRPPLLSSPLEGSLPLPVGDFVDALRAADLASVEATLETDATFRDAHGAEHRRGDGGVEATLRPLTGARGDGGFGIKVHGTADDGRTVALECTAASVGGRAVPEQPLLLVLGRGDSGLIRSVRLYGEVRLLP